MLTYVYDNLNLNHTVISVVYDFLKGHYILFFKLEGADVKGLCLN